jgi:hypothetical protein
MPKLRYLLLAVIIWALAWFLPWQSSALIRVTLATILFILPGACVQQWIYARAPDDLLRHITVGFAVSVGITALLGIVARTLHLPYTFVSTGLFLIGVAALFGVVRQRPTPPPGARNKTALVIGIALIAACAVVVTQLGLFYSYNRGVFVDDYSYAAQTAKFRTSAPYSFQEIMHGTGYTTALRNLFAMLPLSYAVIAQLGSVPTFEFFLVFRVIEVFLFVAALSGLARALKLSWTAAALVVVIQTAIIVRFYLNADTTSLYPEFLQDKGVAAYVLAPVLLRVVFDYLESPGRTWWLIVIVTLAVTFAHPTMFVITGALIGLILLILLIQTHRWQPVALVIAILMVGALPHIPLRLADRDHKFTIAAADEDMREFSGYGTWENRMGDMTIYDYHHNLYGLRLDKFTRWPYMLFFAAVILSLPPVIRRRSNRLAVFLAAGGLLWLSTVLPLTGPIWGLLITPLHIRRVLWQIPLALGAVYLVQTVFAWLRLPSRRMMAANLIVSLVILGAAVDRLPAHLSRNPLSTGRFPPFYTDEIVSLSDQWGDMVDQPVVALGTKRYLNNVIPSLLPETQVIYYRNVRTMIRQNNIPLDEAVERYDAFRDLTSSSISFPTAWALLNKYHVDYILADRENTRLIRMLGTEVPDQFVQVVRTRQYRLYRIIRKED